MVIFSDARMRYYVLRRFFTMFRMEISLKQAKTNRKGRVSTGCGHKSGFLPPYQERGKLHRNYNIVRQCQVNFLTGRVLGLLPSGLAG